jgi:hypothetical protein
MSGRKVLAWSRCSLVRSVCSISRIRSGVTPVLGRTQIRNQLHPRLLIDRPRIHHRREEDVGDDAGFRADEALGSDAYDLLSGIVISECFSHNVRVARRPAFPVFMAQHGHRMRAGREIVIRRQQTSGGRPHSESPEHIAGNKLPVKLLRFRIRT